MGPSSSHSSSFSSSMEHAEKSPHHSLGHRMPSTALAHTSHRGGERCALRASTWSKRFGSVGRSQQLDGVEEGGPTHGGGRNARQSERPGCVPEI